ncbi:MAG: arginine--tRNA ligase [Chitinophagales bacterium]
MNIELGLKQATMQAIEALYGQEISEKQVNINETRKEYAGDLTILVFPFTRMARKKPEQVGQEIGTFLKENLAYIADFNVIKGFLNLEIKDSYWTQVFNDVAANKNYGQHDSTGQKVVLEYVGPNTNKPLHLGHLRNMFLGHSVAAILSAYGHEVHKVNIYNDRGIAICKSMVAWKWLANKTTPETENMKGDHFVGAYYVKYDQVFRSEVAALVAEGMERKEAEKKAPIYLAAQRMLVAWEAGDKEVIELWKMMNNWVYAGIQKTYDKVGVTFEKDYCESEYYLRGKEMADAGLKDGIAYKKDDGSVWIDLEKEKLDQKLLLRKDGTSVYITQDLAVAEQRFQDFDMDKSIYVVGKEQEYHFKVLQATLKRFGKSYAAGIYHLSYGMVDLPEGKMKSREGTVVDADDLIQNMIDTAEQHTSELGKTEGFSPEEAKHLYEIIGLGALKYFILKVNAKKRMLFNPKESIDFLGHTGPFIQYSYARIQSILRKFEGNYEQVFETEKLEAWEKQLIIMQYNFKTAIADSAKAHDPAVIANYAYFLAKTYNKFYAELPILNNEEEKINAFRVALSAKTAQILHTAMNLLGINVPERM